jgi:TonB family protein
MIESGNRLVNPAAKLISAMFHIAIGGAGIYLVQLASIAPRPPSRARLVFLQRWAAEAIVPPIERVRLTPPPLAREARQAEPAPPRIEPPPPMLRVEPLPPVPAPALPRPVATPPPKPIEVKAVSVGVFARAEAPNAKAPDRKPDTPVVGGFDRQATARARAESPAPSVTAAGFSSETPVSKPTASGRVVNDTGFGSEAVRSRAPKPVASNAVHDSGFDAQPSAVKAVSQPVKPDRIDVPLEILFKPAPTYTEDARAQKIEGEVLLEVEFTASNDVRVVRVVRGLGHGLDEAAVDAARRIRFKPAQSSGRPVDFKTTVHIVFRLT